MLLELKKAYLLLGSNLGDRELYLKDAIKLIKDRVGDIFVESAIYDTEAWGKTDQPGFLNLALGVQTPLKAIDLLHTVLDIEQVLGRVRHEKWGSRLIDIDIILYNNEVISIGNELKIPHPEMSHRKFVMQPLAEIAPNEIHPILKKSVSEILENLNDSLSVAKR